MNLESTAPLHELPQLPAPGYGDGYDWITQVRVPWATVAQWGRDGWDMGSWPYVIILWCSQVVEPEDRLPKVSPVCIHCRRPVRQTLDVPSPAPRGVRTELNMIWITEEGSECPATEATHRPSMRTKVYGVASYCEGDVTRYAYETHEQMIHALDAIAHFHWRHSGEFASVVPIGPLTEKWYGPFSWKRCMAAQESAS